MEKLLVLLVLALTVTSFAAASTGGYSLNGSEPAFLRDIGPQDMRVDNPVAAAVVALAVAAIIVRGLRRHTGQS